VDNAFLGHFAQLCTQIQEMVLTGVSPVPSNALCCPHSPHPP
jgi:hypothetical protein